MPTKHRSDRTVEHRFCSTELRFEGGKNKRRLMGYAAVWGQIADISGIFKEVFRSGMFKKSLKEGRDRIVALFNHDANMPLGRFGRSLDLWQDGHGLAFTLDLGRSRAADDVLDAVERGDVQGMSVAFEIVKQVWTDRGNVRLREITEGKLRDISPVTFPVYEGTSVEIARSVLRTAQDQGLLGPATATTQILIGAIQRQLEIELLLSRNLHS